jgi:hypothetical protein
MTRALVLTGVLATATLFAHGARAQENAAPVQAPTEWMSIADLSAKLETQGYTIEEIERDDGLYEVKMSDANGMRVEAYLDPATGEPIRDRDRLRDRDRDEYGRNRDAE